MAEFSNGDGLVDMEDCFEDAELFSDFTLAGPVRSTPQLAGDIIVVGEQPSRLQLLKAAFNKRSRERLLGPAD